jgi:hypothetical protein
MALLSPAGRKASNNGRAKSWDRAYVRSTVFIETRAMYRADGPVDMRPVGEVEFVQGLAAASASGVYRPCRAAAGIVGRADLKLGDRVEPVLEALKAASASRFRGIRHTVTRDPHPEIESREKEKVLASPEYQAGAPGIGADGVVARHRGMLSAIAGARGLCQSRTGSYDCPEPSRRLDADRPLRQTR